MDMLITVVLAVVVIGFLYWLAGELPAQMVKWSRLIVIAGAAIWLIANARAIIHAIAGH